VGKAPQRSGHYCRGKAVTFTSGLQEVAGSISVAPVIFQIHSGHAWPASAAHGVRDRSKSSVIQDRLGCTRRADRFVIGVTHVRKDTYTALANDGFGRFGTEYLKTFVLFVNISACGRKDDYCGCVSAYCPGENAQA
jgi:hypothetical protein